MAAATPSPSPRSSSSDAAPPALAVDDDALICLAYERLLRDRHDVVLAGGGREAERLIEEAGGAFDVVLCDLLMPEGDGRELHERVAARWPAPARRFVFVSGLMSEPGWRAFLAGASNLRLAKPFGRDVLLDVVARTCAGERARTHAERFADPDAILALGAAETTLHLDDAFERIPLEGACSYRLRPGATPGRAGRSTSSWSAGSCG